FDLNRISYYFDHDCPGMLPEDEYDGIFQAVALWQESWRNGTRPTLRYRKSCSSIFIEDGRGSTPQTLDYSDGHAALYEFCMDAKTRHAIETQFAASAWLPGALAEFCDRGLMVQLDGQYLALALPKNAYI